MVSYDYKNSNENAIRSKLLLDPNIVNSVGANPKGLRLLVDDAGFLVTPTMALSSPNTISTLSTTGQIEIATVLAHPSTTLLTPPPGLMVMSAPLGFDGTYLRPIGSGYYLDGATGSPRALAVHEVSATQIYGTSPALYYPKVLTRAGHNVSGPASTQEFEIAKPEYSNGLTLYMVCSGVATADIKFYASPDGANWLYVHQIAAAASITANISAGTTGSVIGVRVLSWPWIRFIVGNPGGADTTTIDWALE